MKRTNFFKTLGAAIMVPLMAPLAGFLLIAPALMADIDSVSELMPFWVQWTKYGEQTHVAFELAKHHGF